MLEKEICMELGTMAKHGLALSFSSARTAIGSLCTLSSAPQVYLLSGEELGMIRKLGLHFDYLIHRNIFQYCKGCV